MCGEKIKVRYFKDIKKMFKSSVRNMTREDTEICQITLNLNLSYNLRNVTESHWPINMLSCSL